MNAPEAALELVDIHKCLAGVDVLRGVNLSAQPGEVISILGASGSGKSTLLRCTNLLEVPDVGEIRLQGETIAMSRDRRGRRRAADAGQLRRLRTSLAMVFQHFNLWSHMTVLENVMEAPLRVLCQPRHEVLERAEQLLQRVGLYERRHYYPAHISGGQQQRAAIARALAMQPRALLFDEPTSALDPELVSEVLGVIGDLAAEGRTMLVVTHELAFARDISHRVIFLHQGCVEEQGTATEVFEQPQSERCRQFLSGTRPV